MAKKISASVKKYMDEYKDVFGEAEDKKVRNKVFSLMGKINEVKETIEANKLANVLLNEKLVEYTAQLEE